MEWNSRFIAGGLDMKLFYGLGPEDRFVEKWLEIKSTDGKPYFLKSVILEDLSTEAFSEIHFHDDQTIWHCPINLFLRGDKGGCFAGLEYPYWDLRRRAKRAIVSPTSRNFQAGAPPFHVAGESQGRPTHLVERPAGLDAHVHVDATRAGCLGPAGQADRPEGLTHHQCHLAYLRPRHAGNRVEVHAQLVGMVEVRSPDRVWVEIQAAQVGHPGK